MFARMVGLGFVVSTLVAWSGIGHSSGGEGDEMGNGGHVVFCKGQDSYQALDSFEAQRMGMMPLLPLPSGDIFTDAIAALQRLRYIDSEREARYRANVNFMRSTHGFVDDVPLPRTNDSQIDSLPEDCELLQAIVQLREPVEGNVFFLINQTIWDKLDYANRVIMIMHEAIYWDSIRYHGQTDAAASRHLNALIFTNGIADVKAGAYDELQVSLRFDVISWLDERYRIQWLLLKSAFPSHTWVKTFCIRRGMQLLRRDMAFSAPFEDFLSSPVGRYHFSARRRHLWLEDGELLRVTGMERVILQDDQELTWGLCYRPF